MFKNISPFTKSCYSFRCNSNNYFKYFYKFPNRLNFDQFKDRPKRHFIVIYKYIEDMHYKRIPYRDDHQKLIQDYETTGNVILGGIILFNIGSFFPSDGAIVIFQANDETVPDSFVKKDPYFKNGLVKDYEIKELELLQKKRFDEIALYYKYR
jgi:uncharacterized protein YciI